MSDLIGKSNLSRTSSSSLVVECTSCSTRFAVDNNQIAGISEPIFHCSRCGHYFSFKDENNQKEKIEDLPATQLSLMPESLNPEPDFTIDIQKTNNENNISPASWYKRNDLDQLLEEDDSEHSRDNKVTVNWPDQKSENKYYIEPQESYTLNNNDLDFQDLDHVDYELDHDDDYDFEEIALPKSPNNTKKLIDSNKFNSITKVSMLVLGVPLFMALFLTYWSFNIDKTPVLINSIFHLDTKLLATVAPQGLALTSITPEVLTLDSGEKAFRIKGDVINSTGSTYSNINLEAKLFTKDNRELTRIIAPLDNSLRDTENIAALNSESIERLQSEYTEERTTIQPNVKVPFSLVVPGVKGEESWYSARIYSVNKL